MNELATIERTDIALTETGWDPQRELNFEEWLEEGRRLVQINRASQWGIGDWLLYGAHRYGEKYVNAALATGYDEQTLKNMRRVASMFEKSRRRDLSWSHHEAVAALEPAEQDRVLDDAEHNEWTREELRKALGGGGNGNGRQPDTDLTSVVIIGGRKLKLTFRNKQLKRRTEEALRSHAEDVGYS